MDDGTHFGERSIGANDLAIIIHKQYRDVHITFVNPPMVPQGQIAWHSSRTKTLFDVRRPDSMSRSRKRLDKPRYYRPNLDRKRFSIANVSRKRAAKKDLWTT
jgi:hypothetical protein